MTDLEKALLGAIEMLQRIQDGKNFSAIEYVSRLQTYKKAMIAAHPELKGDPYYAAFFIGIKK